MIHLTSAQYEDLKLRAGQRDDLLKALITAEHALRSYQYGNGSPDLAKSVADRCAHVAGIVIAEAA